MRKGVFLALLVLVMGGLCRAEDSAKLKANQFSFNEEKREMVASGDVRLGYGDVTVEAQQLHLDVDNNIAWGTGNIRILRGDDEVHSGTFRYDMNENWLKLSSINIVVQPQDAKAALQLALILVSDAFDFLGKGRGVDVVPFAFPDERRCG